MNSTGISLKHFITNYFADFKIQINLFVHSDLRQIRKEITDMDSKIDSAGFL